VIQKPAGRSALSIGMDWGTRVTTIGLEFALPAFLGFGLDRWWGTAPWMTVLGSFLGVGMGMLHVIRLASEPPGSPRRGQSRSGSSADDGDPSA
jgi:ATP synthase protein I